MSKKIQSELESRQKLIARAIMYGCDKEIAHILRKYDALLQGCTNSIEKAHISKSGIKEMYDVCPLLFDGIPFENLTHGLAKK